MNKIKNILLPPLVLFVICAVITAVLAVTNAATKDKIAALEAETQAEAMTRLLPADRFEEQSGELDGESFTYYKAVQGGKTAGYVFVTAGRGYGGSVSVMTALDEDGAILAMEVLSASDETPGLGANALKSDWWTQFAGKSGELAVSKDGGEVDALTGATITSRAVVGAVNTALEYFSALEVGSNG